MLMWVVFKFHYWPINKQMFMQKTKSYPSYKSTFFLVRELSLLYGFVLMNERQQELYIW